MMQTRVGRPYIRADFELEGVEYEFAMEEGARLPAPVTEGIQAAMPGAVLLEAEREHRAGTPAFFEVEIRADGQRYEVEVSEDGRILRQKAR